MLGGKVVYITIIGFFRLRRVVDRCLVCIGIKSTICSCRSASWEPRPYTEIGQRIEAVRTMEICGKRCARGVELIQIVDTLVCAVLCGRWPVFVAWDIVSGRRLIRAITFSTIGIVVKERIGDVCISTICGER